MRLLNLLLKVGVNNPKSIFLERIYVIYESGYKKLYFPTVNVLLVAIFPAIFLFCSNADEARLNEILPVIGIFSVIALVILGISTLITRSLAHSGIIASILILILTNFVLLENLLGVLKMKKSQFLALCLGVYLLLPGAAYAYLDPSVATYAIQVVAGVVLAVGAVVGIYWRKAKKKVSNALGIDENAGKEVEEDVIVKKDTK